MVMLVNIHEYTRAREPIDNNAHTSHITQFSSTGRYVHLTKKHVYTLSVQYVLHAVYCTRSRAHIKFGAHNAKCYEWLFSVGLRFVDLVDLLPEGASGTHQPLDGQDAYAKQKQKDMLHMVHDQQEIRNFYFYSFHI